MSETRPPLPPFTRETAAQKVRMAEDGWNSARSRACVARPTRKKAAGAIDPNFRSAGQRSSNFCSASGPRELDYRLIKELWAFTDNRIAVRFAYEWHDDSGQWFRSYGNENWEFDDRRPDASFAMRASTTCRFRRATGNIHWPLGPPPGRSSGTIRPRALGPLQLPQTRNAVANCRFIADP